MRQIHDHARRDHRPPGEDRRPRRRQDSCSSATPCSRGSRWRVTPTGVKSYIAEGRVNGRTRRLTLGKVTALTIKEARREAKRRLGQLATGHDPVAARQAERARSITLRAVFEAYLASRDLKPGTVADYRRVMRETFPDWLDKPITTISRDRVERRHREFGESRSQARANNAMRVLRAVLNYAAGKYEDEDGKPVLTDNPVQRLSATRAWYRVERRRSLIKAHQLPAWFEAVLNLHAERATGKAEVVRDYLRFVLLTGLRREEAARLTWEDVDFASRSFKVRDTKNREPHELPLSDYLTGLLTRRREAAADGEIHVFPGDGSDGHIKEMRRWLAQVSQQSGVEFTLHDLRRTFITVAESLDIPAYALKRLLNHKSSADVTAGYIVIDTERLREPMQKITDFMLKAAGQKPSAAVVEINQNAFREA